MSILPFVENLSTNGLLAKIVQKKVATQKKKGTTNGFFVRRLCLFVVLRVDNPHVFQFCPHCFQQNIVNAVRIFTRRYKRIFLCDKTLNYQISFVWCDVKVKLFQANIISSLTISVARLRILFIFCTHSIGAAAFNFSVTPSFLASDFTMPENIFSARSSRSAR